MLRRPGTNIGLTFGDNILPSQWRWVLPQSAQGDLSFERTCYARGHLVTLEGLGYGFSADLALVKQETDAVRASIARPDSYKNLTFLNQLSASSIASRFRRCIKTS